MASEDRVKFERCLSIFAPLIIHLRKPVLAKVTPILSAIIPPKTLPNQ
jgi:hypothetical protein